MIDDKITNLPLRLDQRAEYIDKLLRLKQFEEQIHRMDIYFAENPSELEKLCKRKINLKKDMKDEI